MNEPPAAPKPLQPVKPSVQSGDAAKVSTPPPRPREIGGPSGPEPTRYGDWERNGRVSDF
jgi:hypothetical protein